MQTCWDALCKILHGFPSLEGGEPQRGSPVHPCSAFHSTSTDLFAVPALHARPSLSRAFFRFSLASTQPRTTSKAKFCPPFLLKVPRRLPGWVCVSLSGPLLLHVGSI